MYGPKDQILDLDWSRGIDAYNFQAADIDNRGNSQKSSRPYQRKEAIPGFFDDLCNVRFTEDGRLTTRDRLIAVAGLTSGDYPNAGSTRGAFFSSGRYSYFTQDDKSCGLYCIVSGTSRFLQPISSVSGVPQAVGTRRNLTVLSGTVLSSVYYNGLWYVYRDDSTNVSSFTNTGGSVTTVAVSGLPTGHTFGAGLGSPLIWKDRVFAFQGNTVYYSKATDPTVFAAPDGGNFLLSTKATIVDTIIHQDALWILDGENKLWMLDFITDPGVDGNLRQVTIAGDLMGKQFQAGALCVTQGRLFVGSNDSVYEVINENLVDIGAQLHLLMNRHDVVSLYSLDHALLVQGFSFDGSEPHTAWYVYDLNHNAWTRFRFDLFNNSFDKYVVINGQSPTVGDSNGSTTLFAFDCLNISGPVGADFGPLMGLVKTTFFDTSSHADQLLGSFNGTGSSRTSRTIYQRIDTGILYNGARDLFKRFRHFVLDGYFGWRKVGDEVLNLTPFKTTINFLPTSVSSLASSTVIQKVPVTELASVPYRITVDKKARAVQFIFETEDIVTVPTDEDVDSGTAHLAARDVFDRLSMIYIPSKSMRGLSGKGAFVDSGVQ